MNQSSSKRLEYIDFVKGIGIIFVVLGHFRIGDFALSVIYMFHMPLFFMISGFLHKESSMTIGSYVLRKVKTLLYPYFVLGFLYIIYNVVLELHMSKFTLTGLIKKFIALIYGNYIWENNRYYIGTLWFLVALFCVEIIFEIFYRIVKRRNNLLALEVFAITCMGFVLSDGINYSRQFTEFGSGYRLPFCLDTAIVAIAFYLIGFLVKKYFIRDNGILIFVLLAMGFAAGLLNLHVYGTNVNMLGLKFDNPLLFIISATGISIALIYSSRMAYSHGFHMAFIESLGKNSLLIMALHLQLKEFVIKVMLKVGIDSERITAIVLLIATWLAAIVINAYLPWLYKMPQSNINDFKD